MQLKRNLAAPCAALVLAALLAACGNAEAPESTAGSAPPPASASMADSAPDALEPVSQAETANTPAPALADNQVLYNGVVLAPDGDMAPVLEALGEPEDYSEVISCMFESGMDKTYVYAGLTIYTYPTATQERILLLDITAPEAQTSRGVRVGDSLDAALLAYNDVIAPETETRYTATFGEVFFSIIGEEGVVTGLTYELDKTPIS